MGALGALCALSALVGAQASRAQESKGIAGLNLGFAEIVDVVAPLSGGGDHRVRVLDNTDLTLDADLERLVGWQGARAHVYLLGNHGARPNDRIATLQGFDNIEVGRSGIRLFEAWLEQDIGGGSLLVGLYDLNGEFYVTDSAGTLVSPPFGIGSELAGSGPNGPSIFPLSALALRGSLDLGDEGGFVRAALVNADVGSWGDPGGVDLHFREGVIAVAEGGVAREGFKLALGAWAYSKRHEHLWATGPGGAPLYQHTRGIYALLDGTLAGSEGGSALSGFLRGGVIAGQATPYRASAQTGFLLAPALAGRPGSAFSIGLHAAWTSAAHREALAAEGEQAAVFERGIEVTYADEILPGLTLQPDFQIVQNPGGRAGQPAAVIGLLRLSFVIE
ncbi:carbohydrate porin [Novosphingobium sp. 1949]|uniref:Carbohydrate porin n=2 Tax=Novosphingobium organovorum TaxID=2930092 RepID=A0ABT0BEF1_9SPHN|nr:carbohydrate porin [Novosphingobium organovorum]